MAGLILKNISKTFEKRRVLSDISLELADGELLVLLGSSGCGKSTLLRIIAGLEEADSGEVHIGDRRVDSLPPRQRNVALVFQNYSLYPHMTVEKNLAFPLQVAGMSKADIKQRVMEVAEMLDLKDRLGDRPGQLSGGQRQRVALGRAIIRKPSIFLLDEPLSNLDADLRVRMRREIVRIQRELRTSMVHVTHDQTEALTMADRIAILNDGRIEQIGTPEELYTQPASLFVATFIGTPRINILDAGVEDNRLIPFGALVLEHVVGALSDDRRLKVGLRPEAISVSDDGNYRGVVTAAEYLGDHFVITLDYQSLPLTASLPGDMAPSVGQQVHFSIDKSALLYFDPASGRNLVKS
jgi:multiple sugar transport system ATP-binding protein